MTSIMLVVSILVIGLIVWLAARRSRGTAQQADLERDRILKELHEIEEKRQRLIDDSARHGTTVSTDQVLKYVEDLKDTYLKSGQKEVAREIERIISEFREQNGPEIPVNKAYALVKELESKSGE